MLSNLVIGIGVKARKHPTDTAVKQLSIPLQADPG